MTWVTIMSTIVSFNGGQNNEILNVRDLRGKSAQIGKELPNEREMMITSNGRPIAILASISESNLEKSGGIPPGSRRRSSGESSAPFH